VLSKALNQTNIFSADQRPNNNGQSAGLSNPTIAQWFNTSVFSQPAPFTIGTAGRSLPDVRNPGIRRCRPVALQEQLPSGRKIDSISSSAWMFNALNHPNWLLLTLIFRTGAVSGRLPPRVRAWAEVYRDRGKYSWQQSLTFNPWNQKRI
jgi:hypothetical protein